MRKDQNNNAMNTIQFPGCTPTPLASYLKALGIFRVLSQQRPESHPKVFWSGNTFTLVSLSDRTTITDFFLNHYAPSAIVAPWNGGSGFFPKDNASALKAIASSDMERFAVYRETIAAAQSAIDSLSLKAKPETKDIKEKLLLKCRNTFSEPALEWLDSAFVLTDDGAKYPPLLGTGGNDGRLEFTNNFMQRLTEVIDLKKNAPTEASAALLENALFDTPIKGLEDNPIGQFSPAASGGANASTGFDAKSAINPWDFILALEGTMLFAAAAVKRLEGNAPGQLVYPFCVQSSGAGYGSAADADENESRCEIWMPLWNNPVSFDEIKNLFSEGRAWVNGRPAKNGVDFARAVVSLGVDRGITEFQRYGFHVRNGLAYFATPLQRLRVHRDSVIADLLAACDGWVSRFLAKAKTDTAPGSIRRAAHRLETAIFAQASATQKGDSDIAQELLIALGECERTLAGREKWRAESFLPPIPQLPCGWVKATDNNTSEFRLAAALASLDVWFKKEFFPIRRHLEAVKIIPGDKGWVNWDAETKNEVVWNEGEITGVLCAMMKRRFLLAKPAGEKSWPEDFRNVKLTAWPCDIAAFIEGRIDEKRFAQLLWGLCLVDFSGESFSKETMPERPSTETQQELPPAFYAQLKLCFARLPDDKKVPIEPIIFNLAASGDGERASRQALRRLHGSNITVMQISIPLSGEAARRSAAALLFPLWNSQLAVVGEIVAPEFFPNHNQLHQSLTT
jgi:CRISPR-associated protein Csx17